jgi:hypothetical protein
VVDGERAQVDEQLRDVKAQAGQCEAVLMVSAGPQPLVEGRLLLQRHVLAGEVRQRTQSDSPRHCWITKGTSVVGGDGSTQWPSG